MLFGEMISVALQSIRANVFRGILTMLGIIIGVFVEWTQGDLPFYFLPTLGGTQSLRGYAPHRWTARAAWHAGVEYRLWVMPRGFWVIPGSVRIERIGIAFFYEVGGVANELSDLQDEDVLSSAGVSIRISLERTGLFRGDIGFSDEGTNIAGGCKTAFVGASPH